MNNYDIRTAASTFANNSNVGYAKVFSLPINQDTQQVFINTLNVTFQVYWADAFHSIKTGLYSVSLSSINSCNLYCINEDIDNGVCYVTTAESIDIYVKTRVQDACVYVNILGSPRLNYISIHQNEDFIDITGLSPTYPTFTDTNRITTDMTGLLLNSWVSNANYDSWIKYNNKFFEITYFLQNGVITENTQVFNLACAYATQQPVFCKDNAGALLGTAIMKVATRGTGKPSLSGVPAGTVTIFGTFRGKLA